MTDVQLSEHFHSSEFDCHGDGFDCNCGGCGDKMDMRLIRLLEQLRYNCGGYPIKINSGYRCPVHNANVAGHADNSQHKYWRAADLAIPTALSFEEFKWYVETCKTSDGLMFDGIGLYPQGKGYFIHVDIREGGRNGGYYRW